MKRIAIGLLASAGLLATTSAFATDVLVPNEVSPLLHQTRLVCNDVGECWQTGPRRVIVDDGYGYAYPRRYYGERYYYDEPGFAVRGPGVSFGFGFGPRHFW